MSDGCGLQMDSDFSAYRGRKAGRPDNPKGICVSNGNMTYQDLLQIVELIKSSSQFSEFHLKTADIEVDIRRNDAAGSTAQVQSTAPAGVVPSETRPERATSDSEHHTQRSGHLGGGEIVIEPAEVRPTEAGSRGEPLAYPEGAVLIRSPMVGTFYRAAEPGARPFVEVGQQVTADTTVCIIEVMKLMNSIPAGKPGIVTHILVEDGEPVEYSQVMMVIEPR